MWGSRHWRGEGQAKSAVARSAPTGVLAIGRGSGRRGSALTRADDDGFDRGGKYELWRQLGDCSTPPCHPVSAPCERCWVRGEGRRAARHAWQVAETSSTATCRRCARRGDRSTSDLGCFGARVDDRKGKLARFFVSGQCGQQRKEIG